MGKAGLAIGSPSLKKKSSAHSWVSTDDASVSHHPYGLPGLQILPRQDLTTPLGSFLQIPLPTAADLHDAAAAAAEDNLSESSGGDSEDSGDVSASDVLQPLVFPAEQMSPKKRVDKKLALWRRRTINRPRSPRSRERHRWRRSPDLLPRQLCHQHRHSTVDPEGAAL